MPVVQLDMKVWVWDELTHSVAHISIASIWVKS